MAREIERKYTLLSDAWRASVTHSIDFHQGYLNRLETCSVRVRLEGDRANLNIKSAEIGLSRDEYEYPIPLADAKKMLSDLCVGPTLEKVRHFVPWGELMWEIDEFKGENEGLIVAEIELPCESSKIELPAWIGDEVTQDIRYYNVNLIQHPFKSW
jgi:adenylate cyclase